MPKRIYSFNQMNEYVKYLTKSISCRLYHNDDTFREMRTIDESTQEMKMRVIFLFKFCQALPFTESIPWNVISNDAREKSGRLIKREIFEEFHHHRFISLSQSHSLLSPIYLCKCEKMMT